MNHIEIKNKKAYHDYFIEDTLECGIALKGNEVKSIREGKCNIKESWVQIQNNNLVVRGMHISKWHTANDFDVDETRERQLLAHKNEIHKLQGLVSLQGITLIPLKVYFVNNRCKILVGVCKGKHNYDKRQSLKEKQMNRDIRRELKNQTYKG